MNIPIVIGVTGHRDLRQQDIPLLRRTVHTELEKLKTEYPHSEFIMLNSLASGADTLCAEEALGLGISLVCPLPMDADEYCKDFSGDEPAAFDDLLSKADEVFVAPHIEPEQDGRDYLYRQAGIYVAAHSHVLLALWDGSPAKPNGCGTAEAVSFMLHGGYDGAGSCFHTENDGAVIHIRTSRESGRDRFPVSVRLLENKTGSLREVLKMTDCYNAEALETEGNADMLILQSDLDNADNHTKRLHEVYRTADALAMHFQKKYLNAIRCFSIFGMLLVVLFLLYDELECNLFLIGYGLLIAIYAATYFITSKGKSHAKYLQYRVLSETMRTQFYLCAVGLNDDIGNFFTWTQKYESTWIREAVSVLLIGKTPQRIVSDEAVEALWIDGQLAYHKNALKRNSHKRRINQKTAGSLLIASVALFILVLILEFTFSYSMERPIFSDVFPHIFMHHAGQVFTLRSLLKIILGGISAFTAFLTNYYGKLSLERKATDNEKMAALYSVAKDRLEHGTSESARVFLELAREELVECGNWYSYCQESPPTLDL